VTAAKRLLVFRVIGFFVAAILAADAVFDVTARLTRPDFRARDLYVNGSQLPSGVNRTAQAVSINRDILADFAVLDGLTALNIPAGDANRIGLNKAAQAEITAGLAISPANPLMWVTLGLLQTQAGSGSAAAFKASYLTGSVPREAIAKRIFAIATSNAIDDDEVRLLAQIDVRSILTRYPQMEPGLVSAYRQANRSGRAFLIEAARMTDPRFSKLLELNS